MFAPGQDELLNSAPPDPNPAEPKPKDPAAPKKSPASGRRAGPRTPRSPSSKPSVRKPSSALDLSSSSVPVAAVIPADTPQGLAACFARRSTREARPRTRPSSSSSSSTTLCPRHVLNMPVEKCESMLQQHGRGRRRLHVPEPPARVCACPPPPRAARIPSLPP